MKIVLNVTKKPFLNGFLVTFSTIFIHGNLQIPVNENFAYYNMHE